MDRREFLVSAGAAIATLSSGLTEAAPKPPAKRPNVLFILPDQWRGEALGCMGNPDVKTPNLDRLAADGMLVRNTFSNAPVCGPARACLLTGTYTSRNGMEVNDLRLRESERTIANIFADAGYRTGYIGKWHLDGGPRMPGFIPPGARRHGFQFWAANECDHNYFHNQYFRDTDVPIPITGYSPVTWTRVAEEFVSGNQDKPFFLMLAIGAPHNPYVAPPEFMKRYDPEKLTMRADWDPTDPQVSRKDIAGYYAAITAIDEQMGHLFETLKTNGLEDDTIVIFSSDHGDMLGCHGKVLKQKPWEESIRVPGIVRYPARIAKHGSSEQLFSHVDFAPTLLTLCDLPVPSQMQGADFSKVLLGQSHQGPDAAYFQILGPSLHTGVPAAWRGIRTETHMYARFESGPWVLYDVRADPYELKNLVSDPAAASVLKDMDSRLTKWMEKVGDSWKLDFTANVEDGPILTQKPFYSVQEYLDWAKQHPDEVRGNAATGKPGV